MRKILVITEGGIVQDVLVEGGKKPADYEVLDWDAIQDAFTEPIELTARALAMLHPDSRREVDKHNREVRALAKKGGAP